MSRFECDKLPSQQKGAPWFHSMQSIKFHNRVCRKITDEKSWNELTATELLPRPPGRRFCTFTDGKYRRVDEHDRRQNEMKCFHSTYEGFLMFSKSFLLLSRTLMLFVCGKSSLTVERSCLLIFDVVNYNNLLGISCKWATDIRSRPRYGPEFLTLLIFSHPHCIEPRVCCCCDGAREFNIKFIEYTRVPIGMFERFFMSNDKRTLFWRFPWHFSSDPHTQHSDHSDMVMRGGFQALENVYAAFTSPSLALCCRSTWFSIKLKPYTELEDLKAMNNPLIAHKNDSRVLRHIFEIN